MAPNNKGNGSVSATLGVLRSRLRDGTFREILQDWKWIFSYSMRYWKAVLIYIILGIGSTTLGLVSSVAGKYTIDIITGFQTDKLAILIVIMVGSSLAGLLFESLISRISTKLSVRIHNDIQADIFDKIMDADWLALGKFSNGDILNRFNGDITTVSSNAISWLPGIVVALYRFVATFFVILYYDVTMAWVALACAPMLLLLSRFVVKKQREHVKTVRETASTLMSFETESFYNYDTIKSFGTAAQQSKKLRAAQEKHKKNLLDYNLFSISTNAMVTVLNTLVQFAAFGYCLFRLWTGEIGYGTMTLFLQQRSSLTSTLNTLMSMIPAFLNSSVSAHRIRELVELPKEVHIPQSSALDAPAQRGLTVHLEQVDFSYVQGKQVVIQSDLVAQPGQIVALVGASGEGKTTLIRLILGLVRPQRGQAVLIADDGTRVPLNADTRHLFAYVPQGNTILSGTIAENLRMARDDATDEEIIQALKTACAWEFVSQLPDAIYSTVAERGRGLSEGQTQRLAIARAVLRDAPVLLLDEATSALDVATERQVLRSIMQAHPNKTCIVTTHRPSVLGLCHRVYRVMDQRVTELSEEESSRMVMEF